MAVTQSDRRRAGPVARLPGGRARGPGMVSDVAGVSRYPAMLLAWVLPGRQDIVDLLGRPFALPSPPPPLPAVVSHRAVREAISTVLERASANELAEECVRFGLEPSTGGSDDPWHGKWRYVERRLRHQELPDLLVLAGRVTEIYEDPVLDHLLGLAGPAMSARS
jgi:hypothetical protein